MKKYKLKLSEPHVTYRGKDIDEATQRLVDKAFNKREQELKILLNLLQIVSNEIKDRKDLNIILDEIGMIDSYLENRDCMDTEIEIGEQTLNWLREGIEKSVGSDRQQSRRGGGWYKCREIIRQISEPEEVGVKTVNQGD